jgi:hypothetical protein
LFRDACNSNPAKPNSGFIISFLFVDNVDLRRMDSIGKPARPLVLTHTTGTGKMLEKRRDLGHPSRGAVVAVALREKAPRCALTSLV